MSKAKMHVDTEAELVLMMKKQLEKVEKENKLMKQELDEVRKGNTGSEAQIKQLNEMHS
jgi:hypothetical protein